MKAWIGACAAAVFMTMAAPAADNNDDILNHMILSASGDSWIVWNAETAVRDDAAVRAGKATRITAKKGAHAWDAQASITLPKAVSKGDIILIAYYARVETPPPGSSTALIPSAGIGLNKAPYTSFASEAANPAGTWGIYYTSGTADADHPKGTLNFGLQLAGADQVVDLGPVFVFNLGPDWDRTKLPHNRIAAAAPAAQGPETTYAADLAKLRTKLPVKGVLINDPAQIYTYGPEITGQAVAAPEICGGKALRTVTTKTGQHPYDDGGSSPITGPIRKGDTVFVAIQVRATAPANGTSAAVLPEVGVHQASAPYTAIATAAVTAPKGQWIWVFANGVAAADYPSGSAGFGIQLGGAAQTIDLGPVYVLNLGPGIASVTLPNNSSAPF